MSINISEIQSILSDFQALQERLALAIMPPAVPISPPSAPAPSSPPGAPMKQRGRPKKTVTVPAQPNLDLAIASPSGAESGAEEKRGRGRPKGSHNKPKTESDAPTTPVAQGEKRGRGRPKGSPNKAKSEDNDSCTSEQHQPVPPSVVIAVAEKRGRGRPKGAHNKPKAEDNATA